MSSPLREARSLRGWTATQLQAKLRAEAAKRGLVLPDNSSLRVMISKWENGHRAPDLMYQALLQAVYDLPPEALGFTADDEANGANEVVLPALTRRMGVRALEEPAFHDYFTAQLAAHARADNLMGPTLVVGTAQAQALELERLVTRSDSAVVPPESFTLAAHFNELAGWLLQDGGQFAKALETTNKAVDLAKVAEDQAITAYCLMRKSNVLHSLGQMRAALAVATEAVDLANAGAPELLPVCYRQQALAAAGCARRDEAQRFLDNALSAAEAQRPSSLDEYCTKPYVQMEAARCWISLDQPARAVEISRQALSHWPAELVRDKSLCAAHLALALTMSSEIDDACQATLDAVLLIESAPSARAIQAVKQAASNLAPFRQSKRVRDTIREVARVAQEGSTALITTATSHDVRDLNSDIAVLPIGSFEQHGAHLPLTTDTLIGHIIASRIAADYALFLLPPITIACSHEHADFPGTVSISATTLHHVIRDVQDSLTRSGASKLVLVNGHGGNYVLSNVVQESNERGQRMVLYPTGTEWNHARRTAGLATDNHTDMHAGEAETSIPLAQHPDLVGEGYFEADWLADDRRHLLSEGVRAYSDTGVIGRPSLATADKGRKLLDAFSAQFKDYHDLFS